MENSRMANHTTPRRCLSGPALPRLAIALMLLNMMPLAMAGKPDNVTPEEMALIPAYCPYTQSWEYLNRPEGLRWAARVGPGFGALHHYCWGQINLLRAMRSSTQEHERRHLLNLVRGDYGYVVRNSPRDFILLPEIHTRIGEVEIHLALFKDANQSFARARALKPDYWPAYSHWADFLIRSGKLDDARKLVKTGLEYSPGAKVLRDQYRRLGGNPSEILPIASTPVPKDASGKTAAPEESEQSTLADETQEDSHSLEQKTPIDAR